MPGIEYTRLDLTLRIETGPAGALQATSPDAPGWIDAVPLGDLDFGQFAVWRDSTAVQKFVRSRPSFPGAGALPETVPRLVLEAAEPALHAHPFEQVLRPFQAEIEHYLSWPVPIVRLSPVRPRVLGTEMTLPVRILEVDPDSGWAIPAALEFLVGSHFPIADRVYEIDHTSLTEIAGFQAGAGWKTAEVLHFGHWPAAADAVGQPEKPGTLGWLSRLCDTWQTRLVILHCRSEQEARDARVIAARLAARGGPAVAVPILSDTLQVAGIYEEFYTNLIHDLPLDVNWRTIHQNLGSAAGPFPALWGGGGREEAMRFSTLGARLLEVASKAAAAVETEESREEESSEEMTSLNIPRKKPPRRRPGPRKNPLVDLADLPSVFNLGSARRGIAVSGEPFKELFEHWGGISFDRESRGVFPLADYVRRIRESSRPVEITRPQPLAQEQPRFLQAALFGAGNLVDGLKPRRVSGALVQGKTYLLGIHIGPRGPSIRVVGDIALVEENFKWTPEMDGVWVEIGVTGLDFEVLGDPVQELWLPRHGPSERIYFTIRSRGALCVRLRVCLYHQGNMLESIRFAAIQRPASTSPVDPGDALGLLAAALDLEEAPEKPVWQLARLEYSLCPNLGDFEKHSAKSLSIVANDFAGVPVITLKDNERFSVRSEGDIGGLVTNVRDTLVRVAVENPDADKKAWKYAFIRPDTRAAASDNALKALASAGWKLFSAIAPADGTEREKLAAMLDADGCSIQVAQILLQKVIPWAAIYDRKYDAAALRTPDGVRLAHEVCHVSLDPIAAGSGLPACGEHPSCPLHPTQMQQRNGDTVRPSTVVCPRHFWGFRHVVEIPVQQASSLGKAPSPPCDTITVEGKMNMVAGFHGWLQLLSGHRAQLTTLLEREKFTAAWRSWEGGRDRVLHSLSAADLDLIYFYCHAKCVEEIAQREPLLLFCPDATGSDEDIAPADLDFDEDFKLPWSHHPLVFLNGCGTTAFSPRALSPFISMLVERRGAGGVLGAEAPVWEAVAIEMAELFLTAFLSGRSAGDALLAARRQMLSQQNPLGLNYTFYGLSRLSLSPAGSA